MEATPGPEIHHVRDAELRIFAQEPGTDDASDMYVLEVLGVSVLVRLITDSQGTIPRIMVEASGAFQVGVNDDSNDYGQPAEDGDMYVWDAR